MGNQKINLFYEEPDPDRWLPYDRYPRKLIRRIIRGAPQIGGVMLWYIHLRMGLDKLGVPYRINDYSYLKKNPHEWALVIGKPHVLEKIPKKNPIIFGPGVGSHPSELSTYSTLSGLKQIIVSCKWLEELYSRDLQSPIPVSIWPSGIDTETWRPVSHEKKAKTILVYDKVRWDRESYESELIAPIVKRIEKEEIAVKYIRYGKYKEKDFKEILGQVDAMIFLCEHETQGFAYLQTLSANVPIFAWDRGGPWKDPSYYPDKVYFEPVTSVPYWDSRCGEKFSTIEEFQFNFSLFWKKVTIDEYQPREFILENFRLEERSAKYLQLIQEIRSKAEYNSH